ncbi:TonB-dependent receptor [Caulobacter sp. RHG1]|uniref:TonB-dependent receptor n=1 Tax=Caulobacter sp. (strain RHG1) TaxID=2545762 RepID=UPI001557FC2F|nr:TonB-dependent receptor [Caulobacter sp. RHG1]NQE61366.1 TonB-dependent receptor [Caulobacter sp. RHG1]
MSSFFPGRRALLAPALLLGASLPALAWAADAPPEAAGAAQIDQIVVTAQRRAENLQKVPVAITVISGEDLEKRQTFSAEQLVQQVPSLTFRKGTTNVNSSLNIRGIGTTSFSSGSEPAVSTVVDGVVYARSGQAFFDFFDVERIEVLRGPQGTLFGKNASAGVVSVVTRRPSATTRGFAEASYFEGDEYRLRTGVSGPISDTLRGGLTAVYGKYDGSGVNVYDGSKINGYERLGFRAKLEWTPNDRLTVGLIADTVNAVDNGSADVIGYATPGDAIIGLQSPLAVGPSNRNINNDVAPVTKDSTWGYSGQVDYLVGEHTLTSITAWRGWGNTEVRDGDFTSTLGRRVGTASSRDIGVLDFTQFTQEVRLASPTSGFIDYVVGAFYYKTKQDNYFNRTNVACASTTLAGGVCAPGSSTFAVTSNGTANFTTELENYAAFGQANLNFTPRLRGIVGLRWSHDQISYDFARVSAFPTATAGVRPSFTAQGTTTTDGVSGRVGLQYDFSDAVIGYVNYARGYKGPAINVFFNMQSFDTLPLSPEKSDAYEAGLKTTLLDRKLVLNLAAFSTKFSGFQTTNFDTVAGTIVSRLVNAGDVSTKGLELDAIARPIKNLTLTGGGSYTNAKIVSFYCPPGSPASCSAINGQPLGPAKFRWSGAVDYLVETPALPFDIGLNSSIAYQGKGRPNVNNPNIGPAPEGFSLWDASVALVDRDDRYRLTFIAKNIGDSFYTTARIPSTYIRQQVPRDSEQYFGVSLRANFGR